MNPRLVKKDGTRVEPAEPTLAPTLGDDGHAIDPTIVKFALIGAHLRLEQVDQLRSALADERDSLVAFIAAYGAGA